MIIVEGRQSENTGTYKEDNKPITKRNISSLYLVLWSFHLTDSEFLILFFKIGILLNILFLFMLML